MHDGIDAPIEQPIFGLKTPNPERTEEIMSSAALIRPGEAPQSCILIR